MTNQQSYRCSHKGNLSLLKKKQSNIFKVGIRFPKVQKSRDDRRKMVDLFQSKMIFKHILSKFLNYHKTFKSRKKICS